jgi:hypothetical protein
VNLIKNPFKKKNKFNNDTKYECDEKVCGLEELDKDPICDDEI